MLAEGYRPGHHRQCRSATGMPRGPLEMHDDVALDLSYKIGKQTKKDLGDKYVPNPGEEIVAKMVEGGPFRPQERQGVLRLSGSQGPQDALGRPDRPRADVRANAHAEEPSALAYIDELKTRLLYRQAVEVARCWEEGVIDDPREADLGAILGWGFAPWTGGPITLIDQTGLAKFVETADRLAATYGDRFKVPQLLRDMAARGETFYGNFAGAQKAAA
jgi:3-hydroxyacyl-CoA dehydrogenase/enoyl-CoA hydratase/3-hydroxybutyryl-CoA epimerase